MPSTQRLECELTHLAPCMIRDHWQRCRRLVLPDTSEPSAVNGLFSPVRSRFLGMLPDRNGYRCQSSLTILRYVSIQDNGSSQPNLLLLFLPSRQLRNKKARKGDSCTAVAERLSENNSTFTRAWSNLQACQSILGDQIGTREPDLHQSPPPQTCFRYGKSSGMQRPGPA